VCICISIIPVFSSTPPSQSNKAGLDVCLSVRTCHKCAVVTARVRFSLS